MAPPPPLRTLALCVGAGGLELGIHLATQGQAHTLCYVEKDPLAAALLVARIQDGSLDDAPIWDDVTTFDGEPWRGRVDLITAGFPCQPASTAGQRRGTTDARWIWPHIARILREVEAPWVFLENVAGLLTVNGGAALSTVLGALAALGYDAEWDLFSAADVGARHLRQRLFILARLASARSLLRKIPPTSRTGHPRGTTPPSTSGDDAPTLANTDTARRNRPKEHGPLPLPTRHGTRTATLGDSDSPRPQRRNQPEREGAYTRPAWPPSPTDQTGWARVLAERPHLAPALPYIRGNPTATQSQLRRVAHGLAGRLDELQAPRAQRLRILGNGVVPQTAALALHTLHTRLMT